MSEQQVEICIIGGGPAGAVAAMRLVALGHQVCLLERHATPPRRVGESLTPGVWPILDMLGLRERVARAGFLVGLPSRVRWASEQVEFVEQRARELGLLVDRARFDELLLTAAHERGVRVLRPAETRRVERRDGGHVIHAVLGAQRARIRARFVVDASGRQGILSGSRRPTSPRTVAIHGYFEGDALPQCTHVEALEDGWIWGAPLPDGTFSVMLFAEPNVVARVGRDGLEGLLRARFAASSLFSACAHARLQARIRGRDATAYEDPESIGLDYVKLGDAAFSLDPLSSTGVEKAMHSALSGSIAVHTILERPASASCVFSFHAERQRETVERHVIWTASHYQGPARFGDSPFWRRRAVSPIEATATPAPSPLRELDLAALWHVPVRLADETRLVEIPCIQGAFIEPRLALHHPSLQRPVAFLGNLALAPLVEGLQPGGTLMALVRRWAPRVSPRRGLEIAGWLIAHGILCASSHQSRQQ